MDFIMLRNGRPYLNLSGDTTRDDADRLARDTAAASVRMGRPARFAIIPAPTIIYVDPCATCDEHPDDCICPIT